MCVMYLAVKMVEWFCVAKEFCTKVLFLLCLGLMKHSPISCYTLHITVQNVITVIFCMFISPFKAFLLLDSPTGSTLKVLCSSHTVFMCIVLISERTVTFSLCNIHWLVFITTMKIVYCTVWTWSSKKTIYASCLKC